MPTKSDSPSTSSTPGELVHVHQWCYHGELLVVEGEHETHRQEFCVGCGTTRVWFPMGWAYQYPDLARRMLERCTEVKDSYISKIPERVYQQPGEQPTKSNRLGRGLADLQKSVGTTAIKGLFPKPKGE